MATVNYTLPIYEAVVCNLVLEKVGREQAEQEQAKFLAKTIECVVADKEVIKVLRSGDFAGMGADAIAHTRIGLGVLLFLGRQSVVNLAEILPSFCDKYRTALATAMDDMNAVNDRLEDICEAWIMASDEPLISDIKQSLSSAKSPGKTDSSDWRKALAAISD